MLTRNQVDVVLKAFCEQIGLSCTDMHDDAFCVQSNKGYWLYIWYNGDENIASEMLAKIEEAVHLQKVNLQRSAP